MTSSFTFKATKCKGLDLVFQDRHLKHVFHQFEFVDQKKLKKISNIASAPIKRFSVSSMQDLLFKNYCNKPGIANIQYSVNFCHIIVSDIVFKNPPRSIGALINRFGVL